MNGIYYKDGIYVLIDNDTESDICLYPKKDKSTVSLIGGRINLIKDYYSNYMTINGISIVIFQHLKWSDGTTTPSIEKYLPLSTIVSHLNAIETNGVDAFLENYKKSINFLYGELKELNQKTESQLTIEQEDSKIKSLLTELTKIRELLFSVLAILFSLNVYMGSGLENERVISVCQSIMDSLA